MLDFIALPDIVRSFNAVGLGVSNPGVFGTIESFSLNATVPEPSVLALAILGLLSLPGIHRNLRPKR